MITETDFDRDAAMLAGMVGGHLKHVDSVTSDRSVQANKIDINAFIAPLRGGPPPVANTYDPVNRGYIPEQLVQSMAPDISVNLIEKNSPTLPSPIPGPNGGPGTYSVPTRQVTAKTPEVNITNETIEDIKTIKATLLKIDSTFSKISGMLGKVFNFIMDQEKIKPSKK